MNSFLPNFSLYYQFSSPLCVSNENIPDKLPDTFIENDALKKKNSYETIHRNFISKWVLNYLDPYLTGKITRSALESIKANSENSSPLLEKKTYGCLKKEDILTQDMIEINKDYKLYSLIDSLYPTFKKEFNEFNISQELVESVAFDCFVEIATNQFYSHFEPVLTTVLNFYDNQCITIFKNALREGIHFHFEEDNVKNLIFTEKLLLNLVKESLCVYEIRKKIKALLVELQKELSLSSNSENPIEVMEKSFKDFFKQCAGFLVRCVRIVYKEAFQLDDSLHLNPFDFDFEKFIIEDHPIKEHMVKEIDFIFSLELQEDRLKSVKEYMEKEGSFIFSQETQEEYRMFFTQERILRIDYVFFQKLKKESKSPFDDLKTILLNSLKNILKQHYDVLLLNEKTKIDLLKINEQKKDKMKGLMDCYQSMEIPLKKENTYTERNIIRNLELFKKGSLSSEQAKAFWGKEKQTFNNDRAKHEELKREFSNLLKGELNLRNRKLALETDLRKCSSLMRGYIYTQIGGIKQEVLNLEEKKKHTNPKNKDFE